MMLKQVISRRAPASFSMISASCRSVNSTRAMASTIPAALNNSCRPAMFKPISRSQIRGRMSTIANANDDTKAVCGDYVEVHYIGTLDDGSEFDSSRERGQPLPFTLGESMVVPGFERIVMGMKVGDRAKERIEAEQAYGEWREQLTAKVPINSAPEGLEPGMMVQLQNGMTALVTEIDGETVTIDANPPLAGQALTFDVELMKLVPASQMSRAAFGAGCFWGVELAFQRLPGVISTEVGYSQGKSDEITYEEVCRGDSGAVEVVKVTYDEKELPFEKLCEAFFEKHDPTTLNRQGNDVGEQYRSGIYYTDEQQKEIAEKVMEKMQNKYSGQVVTELEELNNYCRAEDYHQQYLAKGGRFGRPQDSSKGCNDPIRCYG